jgi:hypothetical protein
MHSTEDYQLTRGSLGSSVLNTSISSHNYTFHISPPRTRVQLQILTTCLRSFEAAIHPSFVGIAGGPCCSSKDRGQVSIPFSIPRRKPTRLPSHTFYSHNHIYYYKDVCLWTGGVANWQNTCLTRARPWVQTAGTPKKKKNCLHVCILTEF